MSYDNQYLNNAPEGQWNANSSQFDNRSSSTPSKYRSSRVPSYIPGWPQGPLLLKLSFFRRLLRVFPELFLLVVSLGFAVLGIFIIFIKNTWQAEKSFSGIVIQVTRVAPTIWPLVFAATVGGMLKSIAHSQAERGTTIGSLEQLIGSQTVFSAVKSAFTLRICSISTLVLLIVWSLNPIGGQASLRAVSLETNPYLWTDYGVTYMASDPRLAVRHQTLQGGSSFSMYRPLVSTLFGAALFSPEAALQYEGDVWTDDENYSSTVSRLGGTDNVIKRSTTDTWGNVRIPVLHLLNEYDPFAPSEWVDVLPSIVDIPPYESIISVPVRDLPLAEAGNMTFTIEANYNKFECSDWVVLTADNDTAWYAKHQPSLQGWTNTSTSPYSMISTGFFMDTTMPFSTERSDICWSNDNTSSVPARDVVFGSRGNNFSIPRVDSLTTCQITMEYVEARVNCSQATTDSAMPCAVTAVRQSQRPHLSSNLTQADFGPSYVPWKYIGMIFGAQHDDTSTPQEVFMYRPLTAFTQESLLADPVMMYEVPIEIFQNRLAFVYNTFVRSMTEPSVVVGGTFNDTAGTGNIMVRTTNADWLSLPDPVYKIHMVWFTIYMVSVGVLLICAVVAVVVRARLRVPEVLGSVSSLTRDSPFVDIPAPASALDGDDRARLLRKHWVRLQDVQPGEQVGRIALSSDRSMRGENLMAQRVYL